MTMKTVTSWMTLMLYAKELGRARSSGDEESIKRAQQKHDEYRDLCLRSDYMLLHLHRSEL